MYTLCMLLSDGLVLPAHQTGSSGRSPSNECNLPKDNQAPFDTWSPITSPGRLMAVCWRRQPPPASIASSGEETRGEAGGWRSPLSVLPPLNNVAPPPLVLPTVTCGLSPVVQQQGSLIIGSTAAQSEKHCSFLTSLETAIQLH